MDNFARNTIEYTLRCLERTYKTEDPDCMAV